MDSFNFISPTTFSPSFEGVASLVKQEVEMSCISQEYFQPNGLVNGDNWCRM